MTTVTTDGSNAPYKITLSEVEALYQELNQQHFAGKLPQCRLELSRKLTRTAGKIWPRRYLMRLSISYHEHYGRAELSNTILHEMIHLWLHEQGLPSGHTAQFRQKLLEVGLTDRLRALPVPSRPYKYRYQCPACGLEFKTRRKINGSCGKCAASYNSTFHLVLQETLTI